MGVIGSYLLKSKESLESARDNLSSGRYNSCANRAYYACYQVAVALLTKQGIDPTGKKEMWKHEAVQAQIAQLIKRKKVLSSKHKDTLSELMIIRIIADYKPQGVGQRKANEVLKRAKEFVKLVGKEASK